MRRKRAHGRGLYVRRDEARAGRDEARLASVQPPLPPPAITSRPSRHYSCSLAILPSHLIPRNDAGNIPNSDGHGTWWARIDGAAAQRLCRRRLDTSSPSVPTRQRRLEAARRARGRAMCFARGRQGRTLYAAQPASCSVLTCRARLVGKPDHSDGSMPMTSSTA